MLDKLKDSENLCAFLKMNEGFKIQLKTQSNSNYFLVEVVRVGNDFFVGQHISKEIYVYPFTSIADIKL